MARLFVSQERLDRWNLELKVSVDADVMTLLADGASFRLTPAVRFLRPVAEAEDPQALVGRVKSEEQLAALGADHFMESVVLGDAAYDVQPGFLAEPAGEPGELPSSAALRRVLLKNL